MKVKTNKRPCTRLLFAATTAAVLLFSCNTSDDWSDDHLTSASAAYISAVDATYAAAAGSTTTTDVSMKVSLSGDTLAKGFTAGTTVYNPSDSNVEPNLVVITVKNNAGSLVDTVKPTKIVAKEVTAGASAATFTVTMESNAAAEVNGTFNVAIDGTLLSSHKTVNGSGGSVKIGTSYAEGSLTVQDGQSFTDAVYNVTLLGSDTYTTGAITATFYDEFGAVDNNITGTVTVAASTAKSLTLKLSGTASASAYNTTNGSVRFTLPGIATAIGSSGTLSESYYSVTGGINNAFALPIGVQVAEAAGNSTSSTSVATVIDLAALGKSLAAAPAAGSVVASGTLGGTAVKAKALRGATASVIPVAITADSGAALTLSGEVVLTMTADSSIVAKQKSCANIATFKFFEDYEEASDVTEKELFSGIESGTSSAITGENTLTSVAYTTTVPANGWEAGNGGRYVPVIFTGDSTNGNYVSVAQGAWSQSITTVAEKTGLTADSDVSKYYELAGGTYVLTSDTEYNAVKIYYEATTKTDAFGRASNGSAVNGSLLSDVSVSGNFVVSFDVKLSDGNNQASSFLLNAKGGSQVLLKMAAMASASTVWKINDSYLEATLPNSYYYSTRADGSAVKNLSWYTIVLKYIGGKEYLSIYDKETGEAMVDQRQESIIDREISDFGSTAVTGFGNFVFNSARYYSNFAIDNIAVYEVTPTLAK